MHKTTKTVTALALGLMLSSSASAGFSGNIGATTNYLWRGVSQTADSTAVQGGLDYEHESGFYAGTWISNVDFGDGTSFEMDLYAGYAGSITEDLSYDVFYLLYGYPDAPGDVDFGELTAVANWKWLSVSYAHTIHGGDDIASAPLDSDDMGYLQANVSIPLADGLALDFHYGMSSGDIVESWYGVDDYSDYSATLSKDTSIGTVSFAVADTDLDGDDAKVVLGYSYSFDL
ncbi:TorF family putative porin [Shewanella gelidii]|uniref:TIGR02001 family outer membrane protein n=1 Tax=Shewanella gelidii TaxID=1642821 RepID=A0A917JVV6_9GAMM|nr:TorF family putative porin [Shewanella gelidii]MCL1098811.1 TorF family putative porin [Shewanella gelidii]GGI87516.1 hypothetical protein GCM10009332_25950 [Shewanella gelidii]